jgi:hypothetical protein
MKKCCVILLLSLLSSCGKKNESFEATELWYLNKIGGTSEYRYLSNYEMPSGYFGVSSKGSPLLISIQDEWTIVKLSESEYRIPTQNVHFIAKK